MHYFHESRKIVTNDEMLDRHRLKSFVLINTKVIGQSKHGGELVQGELYALSDDFGMHWDGHLVHQIAEQVRAQGYEAYSLEVSDQADRMMGVWPWGK